LRISRAGGRRGFLRTSKEFFRTSRGATLPSTVNKSDDVINKAYNKSEVVFVEEVLTRLWVIEDWNNEELGDELLVSRGDMLIDF
jgi:hypothetical protein